MNAIEGNKHNELQKALKEMRDNPNYQPPVEVPIIKHGYILLLLVILCLAAVMFGFWLGITAHYEFTVWSRTL